MPKSKAKSDTPRGGAGLYIGLAAGGLLLLTCCCGTSGGLGYYFWSKDGLNEKLANAEKKSSPRVGKWEVNHKVQGQEFKRELEFTASGTGALNVTAFKALARGKNEEMRAIAPNTP